MWQDDPHKKAEMSSRLSTGRAAMRTGNREQRVLTPVRDVDPKEVVREYRDPEFKGHKDL